MEEVGGSTRNCRRLGRFVCLFAAFIDPTRRHRRPLVGGELQDGAHQKHHELAESPPMSRAEPGFRGR